MNNRILKTAQKYNMLSYGDTVVAAVSGGADSMIMLDFLLSVKETYNLKIIVAHMEHGIRGQESLDDADFVKDYCENNNVEYRIKHIDALREAQEASKSVEEYSREKRYEFFYSIPCDKIATAHNLSDNAETVLFRLARGTGLKGMCGIPPVRDKIIRPLIEISSDEIRKYCSDNNISYRIDSTNCCNDYSRNIIRNEILPLFNKINSSSEIALNNFISDACEDYVFIEKTANSAFWDCCYDNMLSVEKLKKYDFPIIKRVVTEYFKRNSIYLDRIHLDSVCKIIDKPSKVQLCGNIFAVSNKQFLRFADLTSDYSQKDLVTEILNINEFTPKNIDFYCDCDKIVGSTTIRNRKPGDEIKPVGRGCTKTLKKLFNESSVPIEKRDRIPIVCDDLGIIGVIGICTDERVKVDKTTKKVLSIKLPSED